MGMHEGWSVISAYMDRLSEEGKKGAIYRGQSNYDWWPVASGFRGESFGLSTEQRLDDWKWRAARFAAPVPQDNVEWLIMAQHYGLATPLLDWTTSPLVALYFACAGEEQADYDGCVWVSHQNSFDIAHNTLMINPFATHREKPFLINAVGRNVRSTAQDSILSLHTVKDCDSFDHRRLFDISADAKTATLSQLEKLGISGDRLLYDVGHLVKVMKSEYVGRSVKL